MHVIFTDLTEDRLLCTLLMKTQMQVAHKQPPEVLYKKIFS